MTLRTADAEPASPPGAKEGGPKPTLLQLASKLCGDPHGARSRFPNVAELVEASRVRPLTGVLDVAATQARMASDEAGVK